MQAKNAKARARKRWREVEDLDAAAEHTDDLVLFSSNDYLGLSFHPKAKAAAAAALERWGTGAGSARLLGGSRPVHSELELALARWKSAQRALVFPSGYVANIGVISALAAPGTLVCSDELNHASIIDGCRLAGALGAQVRVFPHADPDAVGDLLRAWPGRAVVVTDAVFSMDGDQAPIEELQRVCAQTGALLVLDEAHSVLGPDVAAEACELLRVGTLSKALGSQGGFVAGSADMVDMLVNRCRSFIFTTALAPASAAAALAALEVLTADEGDLLRRRLAHYCRLVAPSRPWVSPIVPVVVGTEAAALAASASMRSLGLYVPAVRPPTVPPGKCRLRVSLSAAHRPEDIDRLVQAIQGLTQ